MNWRSATIGQLYEIAYHDNECSLRHTSEAIAEINRRQQKKRDSKRAGLKATEKGRQAH